MSSMCYCDSLDIYTEIRRNLLDRVRKCCPRIDLLKDENKFMYLLNSSVSTIKGVLSKFFFSFSILSTLSIVFFSRYFSLILHTAK